MFRRIVRGNHLVFPNGMEVKVKNTKGDDVIYVLVQKEDDPDVFGYVNKSYLTRVQPGGFYEKYLKYKAKYIELKKVISGKII